MQLCLTLCDPVARLFCLWGFSKQEYWSGLLCPLPRDLPNLVLEPASLMSSALAGGMGLRD